ncbi:MAG: VOC family protein [Emcibacteraceae bacterium]|nr:VOC family protein [Emcibacteraceae bacterium]
MIEKRVRHHKINYVEYASKDLEKTKAFFEQAFGWIFKDYGPDYTAFEDRGSVDCGFYSAVKAFDAENGGALIVLYSEKLDETEKKVTNAGGEITKEIFDFPGGRRFHFKEPSGNELAVWGDPE